MQVALLGKRSSSGVGLDQGYLRLRNQGVTADGAVVDSAGPSFFNGGNVGIGTSSPNTQLQINSATDPKIRLESNESGSKRLELWIDGGEAIGYIAADQSASQLAFKTAGTERMRIDSSGNVGIGITDPDQALEIGAGGKLKLSRADNSRSMLLYTNNADCVIQSDTDPLHLQSANRMTFATNGASERMRIDTSGNVGIGTAAPGSLYATARQLVIGNGTADVGMTIYTPGTGIGRIFFADGLSGGAQYAAFINYDHANQRMQFGTGSTGTTDVAIDQYGKVGIGTNSPTTLTEIRGTVPTLTLSSSESKTWANGDDIAKISFFSRDGSGIGAHETGFILNESENSGASLSGALVFGVADYNTAAAEAMRIDSDGNVGIGTDNPTEKLHVEGSLVLNVASSSGLGEEGIFFRSGFSNSNKYNVSIMNYAHDGSGNFSDGISINGYDGVSICTGSNDRQERMRIVGGTGSTSGNVGIGTGSPASLLHAKQAGTTEIITESVGDYFPSTSIKRTGGSSKTNYHWEFQIGSSGFLNFKDKTNSYYPIMLNTTGDVLLGNDTGGSNATMFVDQSTARVGIGTTAPSEKLEVDGGIKISNSNSRLYFGAEGGTSYRALEGNTGGSLLQVGEGYSSIALQGNVAINTTTTYDAALRVVGATSTVNGHGDLASISTETGSVVSSGSIKHEIGYSGTYSSGKTWTWTYAATSWKSFHVSLKVASTAGFSSYEGGGYNNNGGPMNTVEHGNDLGSFVITRSGQQMIMTYTTNTTHIHPFFELTYRQSGGDGSPRMDRLSLVQT